MFVVINGVENYYCNKCKKWYPIERMHSEGRCKDCIPKKHLRKSRIGPPIQECSVCEICTRSEYPDSQELRRCSEIRRFHSYDMMLEERKRKLELLEPIAPLTEDEWRETCNHFNGCAICGDEHIESRLFFQSRKLGGGYNKFNIVPSCGTCGSIVREMVNPYHFYISKILETKLKETPHANRMEIIRYLDSKLDLEVKNADRRV